MRDSISNLKQRQWLFTANGYLQLLSTSFSNSQKVAEVKFPRVGTSIFKCCCIGNSRDSQTPLAMTVQLFESLLVSIMGLVACGKCDGYLWNRNKGE